MESYLKNSGESAYEMGLATPDQQILSIGQEGNSFDQLNSLIDFSKFHGLDLSSYSLTAFTNALSNPNNQQLSSSQSLSSSQNQTTNLVSLSASNPENELTTVSTLVTQPVATMNTVETAMIPSPVQTAQAVDYFDITPFITYSQEKAAKKLGIPKSTLSKRWREATCNRKWPFRQLCKLDREIKTLVHNMHSQGGSIEPQLQSNLATLMRMRQDESRVVYIKNISATSKATLGNEITSVVKSEENIKLVPQRSTMWTETLQNALARDLLKNLQMPNIHINH